MSQSSRPWGVTDRMTRALEALDDLDDALRQVVSGYLVDPSDSPTPTIGDRLALVRSAQDALPSAPDLVLVLTALSVDRAQEVRRAAAQALGEVGSAAPSTPDICRRGLLNALRASPLVRADEAITLLLHCDGGEETLVRLGAERPDLVALADELRGRESILSALAEDAPVPLPPFTPFPVTSAAPAADELRAALEGLSGAGSPSRWGQESAMTSQDISDSDLDGFVAVAEGRASEPPASIRALGVWWIAREAPSLDLIHLTRLFAACGERVERHLLESRSGCDTDPRAVVDALERGGLPLDQARETTADWALTCAEPEVAWPWVLQSPESVLEAMEDWYLARAVLRTLAYAPTLPSVLLSALAQAAVGRSEGNRVLAQRLLARTPVAAELALQALASPHAAVRRAGAAWLADLGVPDGVEHLRRARAGEKDQLVRGDILRALVSYGDDVTDLVSAGALAAPRRRPRAPTALTWFPFDALPVVRLTDGTVLDAGTVQRWVLLAHNLKDPDGRGTIAAYLDLLQPGDARELSAVVVGSWIARNREVKKGESLKTKGLLAFAVGMDGPRLAADARSAMRRNATWRAESEAVLTAVAANRAPEALQVVLAMAASHRLPRVRDFARSLADAAAAERGWSPTELGDRSIPTVGFSDDGLLHLSYGEREFLGRLNSEMTISLTDADGRLRKTLPAPRKTEDRERVAEAKASLATARKELRAVLSAQTRRLYEAMCAGRTWTPARWRELLAAHPIARHLVTRLVWMADSHTDSGSGWQGVPGTGAPDSATAHSRVFRPTEDGELLGVDDIALDLPDHAAIRLAHAMLLTDAEVTSWRDHLADYEVEPLFDQFSARAPDVTAGQTKVRDGEGLLIDARELRRAAEARGYARSSNIYRYSTFLKDFPDMGLRSVIDFAGAYVPEDEMTTTGALSLCRGRREVPLDRLPPVLLAECYADYRAVTTVMTATTVAGAVADVGAEAPLRGSEC